MAYSLRSLMVGFHLMNLCVLPFAEAEQGAWGGNGGWWGMPREWEGDFDGPGDHRIEHPCRCGHHSHPSSYRSEGNHEDDNIPGAGLYIHLNPREETTSDQ